MGKTIQLKLLQSIKTGKGLIKLITNLKLIRRRDKIAGVKRARLTTKQRVTILSKTNSHCHICGIELTLDDFEADHVKSHCMGGEHAENNYLPSCHTCNNYRWHYSSEEMQIILKLGVWAKTKITNDEELGLIMANEFVKHEMAVRHRRKSRQQKVVSNTDHNNL
jgi:hypothetical protein